MTRKYRFFHFFSPPMSSEFRREVLDEKKKRSRAISTEKCPRSANNYCRPSKATTYSSSATLNIHVNSVGPCGHKCINIHAHTCTHIVCFAYSNKYVCVPIDGCRVVNINITHTQIYFDLT